MIVGNPKQWKLSSSRQCSEIIDATQRNSNPSNTTTQPQLPGLNAAAIVAEVLNVCSIAGKQQIMVYHGVDGLNAVEEALFKLARDGTLVLQRCECNSQKNVLDRLGEFTCSTCQNFLVDPSRFNEEQNLEFPIVAIKKIRDDNKNQLVLTVKTDTNNSQELSFDVSAQNIKL